MVIRDFSIHSGFIGWKVHINYFLMTHIISVILCTQCTLGTLSLLGVVDKTSDFMGFPLLDLPLSDERNNKIEEKSSSFPYFFLFLLKEQ